MAQSPLDIEDPDEGGGYLVSVSDLMIGLLFVFLLMLMAFALQYSHAERQQRELIEQQQMRTRQLERELADKGRRVGDVVPEDRAVIDQELNRDQRALQVERVALGQVQVAVRHGVGEGALAHDHRRRGVAPPARGQHAPGADPGDRPRRA